MRRVAFRPDHAPPTFLTPPLSMQSRVGGAVTLSCSFRGAPMPQVTWYRQGKPVQASPHLTIQTKDTVSELVISKVESVHAGEYLVAIRNPYGEDLATATLTIEGIPHHSCCCRIDPLSLMLRNCNYCYGNARMLPCSCFFVVAYATPIQIYI